MLTFSHIGLHADFIIMKVHVSCIANDTVQLLFITKYP